MGEGESWSHQGTTESQRQTHWGWEECKLAQYGLCDFSNMNGEHTHVGCALFSECILRLTLCVCFSQNATLQAEKVALRSQLKQLETQSSNLQAQIVAVQRQTASLQENNTILQTQNAKLQVHYTTLLTQYSIQQTVSHRGIHYKRITKLPV